MSHPQQRLFVESVKNHFLPNLSSVLEIGSYDVNGVVRNILECPTIDQYIGLDLVEGPGVDIVCNASEYNSPHLSELVLSCECFEHNPFWLKTFVNMIANCKSTGIVVFTCATRGRLEHGTSRTTPSDSPGTSEAGWNHYRNISKADFPISLLNKSFKEYSFFHCSYHSDLYFIGLMPDSPYTADDISSFSRAFLQDLSKLNLHLSSLRPKNFKAMFSRKFMKLLSYLLPEKLYQDFALMYYKYNYILK